MVASLGAQRQLGRGQRMIEVLKQDQYQPMPVEQQVTILFAGTAGLLDEIPVAQVRLFEKEMLDWMDKQHPEYLREIREKKDIAQKLEDELKKAIADFTKEFKAAHPS